MSLTTKDIENLRDAKIGDVVTLDDGRLVECFSDPWLEDSDKYEFDCGACAVCPADETCPVVFKNCGDKYFKEV